jgi:small GTP-binding protein
MQRTPRGNRLHIALFGRRNVGKSSLLNALTRQDVSIVSAIAGTTTDPVEKPMELLPLGPVLFIDTAGIDDSGALGELRAAKTRAVLDRTDLAVLVSNQGDWSDFEERLLEELNSRQTPVIVVSNQSDLGGPSPALRQRLDAARIPLVETAATTGAGLLDLREALIRAVPASLLDPPSIAGDLVPPGELAVLVVPIDMEAPKGRLILPQVQTIRDLLDSDACCLVVKERELRAALARLTHPPALVVTDSQAFLKVAADTPPEVKADLVLDPVCPAQRRSGRTGARRAGHRPAAARRPRADLRSVHAPSDRRRHRPREGPPLAAAIRRRGPRLPALSRSRFPLGPDRREPGRPLRQLRPEPSRDALPHPPLPQRRGPDHQLRPDHRLQPRHFRTSTVAFPGRAGSVSQSDR